MTVSLRGHQRSHARAWTLAIAASLLLWNLPLGGVVLYPFKIFATWLHEFSHAFVMMIVGAGFDRVEIFRDGSGLAYARGEVGAFGSAAIAAAGYMGTPVFGAVGILIATTPARARRLLIVLGVALGITAIAFIATTFGQVAASALGIAMIAWAIIAPPTWRIAMVQILAAQACVNAVLDIRVLFRPQLVVNGSALGRSDAHAMAAATFGTTDAWAVWLWAGVWLAWALALLYFAMRWSMKRNRAELDRIASSESRR